MSKYKIIIYWSEEDEAFTAEVPELAGCMADGETYQDALESGETDPKTERKNSFCLI